MHGSRAPAWSLTSCLRADPPTAVSLARSPAVEAFGSESGVRHPLKEERWRTINIQMGSFRALKQLRAFYKYLMARIVYVKRSAGFCAVNYFCHLVRKDVAHGAGTTRSPSALLARLKRHSLELMLASTAAGVSALSRA